MPKCLWCKEELKLDTVNGGYVHQNGDLYKGQCFCKDIHHDSYKQNCPTWRDNHCALPKFS